MLSLGFVSQSLLAHMKAMENANELALRGREHEQGAAKGPCGPCYFWHTVDRESTGGLVWKMGSDH